MASEETKEKLAKVKGKGSSLLDEFKTFIARGNVLDMAVGVIVGGAFGKIVTSLVDNILMPLIGVIIGGIDFTTKLTVTVGSANIKFGVFIQSVIDFIIVAFCIFLFVKFINKMTTLNKKKEEEAKEAAVVKTDETPHSSGVSEEPVKRISPYSKVL